MALWFFASDLHGSVHRYQTLFARIVAEHPAAVLLGGDLMPGALRASFDPAREDFVNEFLVAKLMRLREQLGVQYPRVLVILGNDDPRLYEASMLAAAAQGAWEYANQRQSRVNEYDVYGYSFVPPTPFLLKDWERFDVGAYVDPGCVSPEEGIRTIPAAAHEIRYGTIAQDLDAMTAGRDLSHALLMCHAPPYDTALDRAALDHRTIEHVPMNVHVGSIAIRRFIEQRQPLITLHGHIHESARLSGTWREQIGRTSCFSAAHDGPELALVRFDPAAPQDAVRELL